jgi:hypothetical protein
MEDLLIGVIRVHNQYTINSHHQGAHGTGMPSEHTPLEYERKVGKHQGWTASRGLDPA